MMKVTEGTEKFEERIIPGPDQPWREKQINSSPLFRIETLVAL